MEGDRTAFVTGPRMEVLEVRPTSRHDVKMAGITVECPLLHTATGCGEGNRPVHLVAGRGDHSAAPWTPLGLDGEGIHPLHFTSVAAECVDGELRIHSKKSNSQYLLRRTGKGSYPFSSMGFPRGPAREAGPDPRRGERVR